MRHTCATLMAVLDVHPRVAMRTLRHAQIDVTMNVYTEVSHAKTLKALKAARQTARGVGRCRTVLLHGIEKATPRRGRWPVSWVGVAGFEPAASSSRTKPGRRGQHLETSFELRIYLSGCPSIPRHNSLS